MHRDQRNGNDARVDNFGGGNVAGYTPNLYEVGPGLNGPNQFPAVQYDEGNPPHPVQDALDAAAASPGDDLIVVYPGLATPSNPRLNPRGAYYENLIVHSPVKLQGVGPGSADGSVHGSVLDGVAFGGDTVVADNWRTAIDALTRVGNQDVYEGPVVSVFATTRASTAPPSGPASTASTSVAATSPTSRPTSTRSAAARRVSRPTR